MTLFAMITTAASADYTPYALRSFFQHTVFGPDDRFVLIDNNGGFELPDGSNPRIEMLRNSAPKSFAANVNQVLFDAQSHQADVVFLNNDLIFAPNWFETEQMKRGALMSPLSNGQVQYRAESFECGPALDLNDYLGNEANFLQIVSHHQRSVSGLRSVLSIPFFAIGIPLSVHTRLGPLDETFGNAGAEDKDYCIRAHLEGIRVEVVLKSFVLHFQGKSTWRGAESPQQTQERDRKYLERFQAKWGEDLTRLFIYNDASVTRRPEIEVLLKQGKYGDAVRRLLPDATGK